MSVGIKPFVSIGTLVAKQGGGRWCTFIALDRGCNKRFRLHFNLLQSFDHARLGIGLLMSWIPWPVQVRVAAGAGGGRSAIPSR
jgi:hypothetical protein